MIWKTLESFYQYFNPENSTENTTTTMDTDTDTDIEGLRIQGNNFYSANEYWSAIDAYSQVNFIFFIVTCMIDHLLIYYKYSIITVL